MALYIRITKISEQNDAVQYSFEAGRNNRGVLELDKRTGLVTLIEPLPGDVDEAYFQRAARKLSQHVARGEVPDLTCWAA